MEILDRESRSCDQCILIDKAESAHVLLKTYLAVTDPKAKQHLILSLLGLILLFHHFKKLMHPITSLSQIAR